MTGSDGYPDGYFCRPRQLTDGMTGSLYKKINKKESYVYIHNPNLFISIYKLWQNLQSVRKWVYNAQDSESIRQPTRQPPVRTRQ